MDSNECFARYRAVVDSVRTKLRQLGRPEDSAIVVAVSKTHPAAVMRRLFEAATEQGHCVVFGENYIQEFKGKRAELPLALECHFIGHLQRNKARDAVRMFSVIESVDSVELLRSLQKEAAKEGKLQQIYLQVNISRDPSKGGIAPEAVAPLISEELTKAPNLSLGGLMTITALYANPEEARPDFRALRTLRDELLASPGLVGLIGRPSLELSMGMSGDYLVALEEGATVVRIGSAIFGERG